MRAESVCSIHTENPSAFSWLRLFIGWNVCACRRVGSRFESPWIFPLAKWTMPMLPISWMMCSVWWRGNALRHGICPKSKMEGFKANSVLNLVYICFFDSCRSQTGCAPSLVSWWRNPLQQRTGSTMNALQSPSGLTKVPWYLRRPKRRWAKNWRPTHAWPKSSRTLDDRI